MTVTVGNGDSRCPSNPFDRQLAVLLRQTQWLLDDAAHDIPAGRYHQNKRHELAAILEHVAALMRDTAPMGPPPDAA